MCRTYFTEGFSPVHKRYLALRDFFAEGLNAEQVAEKYGYTVSTVYFMARQFKQTIFASQDPFFKTVKVGRKPIDHKGEIAELVVSLRKKYLSVPDIQIALDARGITLTIYSIEKIITDAGFARLPRRDKQERIDSKIAASQKIVAPVATRLRLQPEAFSTQSAGLLSVIPTILNYGIDKAIRESSYPQTKDLSRMNAILSFVALKLSNVKRYSADDIWCLDRGMGLFAGLNVLPKTAWFSSYSSGVTRDMNVRFLRSLQDIWKSHDLLSDTINMDFTTIPYWGDDEHLENNWSGKRGVKFITIRRRCESLLKHISSIDTNAWRKIKVAKARGSRTLYAYEENVKLTDYEGLVRHVYIKPVGREKPAILITNDVHISLAELVRKYSRRWLVETEISEHIDFFHLNRNSSGIVVKVDFDLTMTMLSHNVMRLFCKDLDGYEHCNAETLFDKFLSAPGDVTIGDGSICVSMKKKRTLPTLVEHLHSLRSLSVSWLDDFDFSFSVGSSS